MNICQRLLGGLFFLCAGASVAAPSCLPLSMVLEKAKGNPKQESDAKVADARCRAVDIEPKEEGATSLVRVWSLVFAPRETGGDRLKPAAPPGMPTGSLLPLDDRIEFDPTELKNETPLALSVDGPGVAERARLDPGQPIVRLPASAFRGGVEYRWLLTTSRQKYQGSFELADAATAQRIGDRLRQLPTDPADRGAAMLLQAAVYDDEELFATRNWLIARYRRDRLPSEMR